MTIVLCGHSMAGKFIKKLSDNQGWGRCNRSNRKVIDLFKFKCNSNRLRFFTCNRLIVIDCKVIDFFYYFFYYFLLLCKILSEWIVFNINSTFVHLTPSLPTVVRLSFILLPKLGREPLYSLVRWNHPCQLDYSY